MLSVMTKTNKVKQCLKKLNWEYHAMPQSVDFPSSPCVAVPQNPTPFFTLPTYPYDGSSADMIDPYTIDDDNILYLKTSLLASEQAAADEFLDFHRKVLAQIVLLANPVTEGNASKQLRKYV